MGSIVLKPGGTAIDVCPVGDWPSFDCANIAAPIRIGSRLNALPISGSVNGSWNSTSCCERSLIHPTNGAPRSSMV